MRAGVDSLDCCCHVIRGCFLYGNCLDQVEEQAKTQLLALLATVNTPHLEYESCNFSHKHMVRMDPGYASPPPQLPLMQNRESWHCLTCACLTG